MRRRAQDRGDVDGQRGDDRTIEQSASPGLRMAIAAGSIVLIACLLVVLWTRTLLSRHLRQEVHQHTVTIARSLAAAYGDSVLTGSGHRLNAAIQQVMATEPSSAFVVVTGTDKRVLAHSFAGKLPYTLGRVVMSTPPEPAVYTTELRSVGMTTYDVSVPVLAGVPARVHVGLREGWVTGSLRQIDLVLGGATLLVSAGAAWFAWGMGRRLGRPTDLLVATAKRIGAGEPDVAVPTSIGDPHLDRIATAFERMQREILEHRDQADRATRRAAHAENLAAMGTLVAGIAHQVNNPLAGVHACLEMLRDGADTEEDRRTYIALALEGIETLARVMGRLTEYARGGLAERQDIDVDEVVRSAVEFCRTWDRQDDPQPVLELGASGAAVRGEPDALVDVVVNLYSNARQAAPGAPIHIETASEDGEVRIEVRDHGPGIPAEMRQRVFVPFFTTRDPGAGTGLGLALSDAIVRRHGGTIEVDAAKEGGARMTVRLLAAEDDQETA